MHSCTFLATKHSQTIHRYANPNQNLPAENFLVSLLSFNKSLCYTALFGWTFSRVSASTFSQDLLSFIEVLPSNYWACAGKGQYEIKPIRLGLSNFDCLWWVSHPTSFIDQLVAAAMFCDCAVQNSTLKSYMLWESTWKSLLIPEHIRSWWDLKWAYCSC